MKDRMNYKKKTHKPMFRMQFIISELGRDREEKKPIDFVISFCAAPPTTVPDIIDLLKMHLCNRAILCVPRDVCSVSE